MIASRCTWIWIAALLLSLAAAAPGAVAEDETETETQKSDGKPAKKKEPAVPAAGDARAAWIQKQLETVRGEDEAERRAALARLVKHDKLGDGLLPLIGLLSAADLAQNALVDVIRTVGIPNLGDAALPLVGLLEHESAVVRGNAAVSLEYVGSAGVAKAIRARIGKEKIASVRSHLCRALGRCGAGDSSVRGYLLKRLGKATTDFERVGPSVGLAYFEGDKSAARHIEKYLLKALALKRKGAGVDPGRKYARLMGWCLSEIGDPKSAAFLRKKVLPSLKRESLLASGSEFFEAVVRKLDGDASAQKQIDKAVYGFAGLTTKGGMTSFSSSGNMTLFERDDMRKGRDSSKFLPKGEPPARKAKLPGFNRR